MIPAIILFYLCCFLSTSCQKKPNKPEILTLGSLNGIVQDSYYQEPIAGAIVKALINSKLDTTDSFGIFHLDNLSMGIDTIQVNCPDYNTFYTTVEISNKSEYITLYLPGKGLPGYNLYVGNQGGDEVYVLDTYRNTVIDTLLGFENYIWNLATTKNGEKLYICTRGEQSNYAGKVFSVDIYSRTISLIWSETASDVFIVPAGEVFIISYLPYTEKAYIGFIDPISNLITHIDTLNIRDTGYNNQGVMFSKNCPLLYAVNSNDCLFAYDYDQKKVVRTYKNLTNPLNMVLSQDGSTIYSTVMGNHLVIFDVEQDSILFSIGTTIAGSLALSADGEYLYITDPGAYMIPEPAPSGKVYIFSTKSMSFVDEIDITEKLPFGYSNQTDHIILMPDGKTAYVSNWLRLIFVIDLQLKEVVEFIEVEAIGMPMVYGLDVLNNN